MCRYILLDRMRSFHARTPIGLPRRLFDGQPTRACRSLQTANQIDACGHRERIITPRSLRRGIGVQFPREGGLKLQFVPIFCGDDLANASSPGSASSRSTNGLSGVLPFQVRLITKESVGPVISSTSPDVRRSAYFLGACHLVVVVLIDFIGQNLNMVRADQSPVARFETSQFEVAVGIENSRRLPSPCPAQTPRRRT